MLYTPTSISFISKSPHKYARLYFKIYLHKLGFVRYSTPKNYYKNFVSNVSARFTKQIWTKHTLQIKQ